MLRPRTTTFRALLVPLVTAATVAGGVLVGSASAAPAAAAPSPIPAAQQQPDGTRKVPMPDGGTISVAPDGTATRTSAQGTVLGIKKLVVPQGSSGLGPLAGPSDEQVRAAFTPSPYQKAPTDVVAALSDATTVTGAPVGGKQAFRTRAPVTSNASVNSALAKIGAVSVQPMFPDLPATDAARLTASARGGLGPTAPDLSKMVLVRLKGGDADAAAKVLAATPGVTSARPDIQVTSMSTSPSPLPSSVAKNAQNTLRAMQANKKLPAAPGTGLPTNFGLTSSLQSFLNAGGTDAMGAYSLLEKRFGQLPGAGEVITNVSVGDLTDQAMADAGDTYVQASGPTTIVQNGQRYLDLPSMPLIPTYTADASGTLDPVGSTEGEDPSLGEVMLDFGVMAPLPHNLQRPANLGSGVTDLLGIAPGAKYRLVVPQQPTFDQIAVALLAAARQNPRPNVITASLGFGTDAVGFPGRYLEDDSVLQTVIASIVQQYHIVVTISANDGTRLFTPTAVGPDGGSTATNTTRDPAAATDINDDQTSTTPSQVLDSGAIAVGGTTLDDTLSVSPQTGGPLSPNPTFATTRTDGGGNFSSGFGSRINVSAPSDGIAVYVHAQLGSAQQVQPVLSGGTSASAPMTAAAAAIVLQAAKLTGKSMSPGDVRSLLANTGRPVATPPQIDQPLNVGRQIDITAAVGAVLGDAHGHNQAQNAQGDGGADASSTSIVRLSVAHRQTIGLLGGEFVEYTDPNRIDLAGPDDSGEGLTGPVTIGADVTGLPHGTKPDYVLRIGAHEFHSQVPAVRLTPTQMLQAAGLPVVSTADRTIQLTFEVRSAGQVLASAHQPLVFGPTDGTYSEALAPVAAATVKTGSPVTVHYDLTGVRNVSSPQLVVSTVGHWSPAAAPLFTAAYTAPLTGLSGDVTIPAHAFDGGGGSYGIGLITATGGIHQNIPVYGEFTPIRVDGGTPAQRPATPTLAAAGSDQFGHSLAIPTSAPGFKLGYDVRGVPGAAGAAFEVSAPAAPTLYNSLNTVTNANGTVRDHDGVDTGSVRYQQLPSSSGTVALDAVKLGLPGSLNYSIRVFPTDRNGKVIGQASATSMLTLDDGLAPDGGLVASFAIQPGGTSAASVFDPATGGESLREYNASTGTYGRTFAADPPTLYQSGYQIIGIDPGVHRLLVLHWTSWGPFGQPCSAANPPSLQTYDTLTAKLVSDVSSGCQYTVFGGRVDTVRHRAAILAHRTSDNADILLPLTLSTGSVGTPIEVDINPDVQQAGEYHGIAMNQATGLVYLSRTAALCTGLGLSALISVNLDSGVQIPAVTLDQDGQPAGSAGCVAGLDVDAGANQVFEDADVAPPSRFLPATVTLSGFTGDTMNALDPIVARPGQPSIGLVIDSTHHLALLPYPSSTAPGDNNATSQTDVVDLTTGNTVSTVSVFNFVTGFWGGHFDPDPASELFDPGVDIDNQPMQLDPATRTGWVISGNGRQIQQFKY